MSNDPEELHNHDCSSCPLMDRDAVAPVESGVSRREFVSAALLTTIAATLSACGGGELSAADRLLASNGNSTPSTPVSTPSGNGTPTVGANQFGVTVASYPSLAVTGGVAVVRTSPAIALARTATGFVAFSLSCTHEGTTVKLQSDKSWLCPNHGAKFSATGAWTGGYRTTSLRARSLAASADKSFVVVNLS